MSRLQRTQQFREKVEKEWTQTYMDFIQENPNKPWNWRYISGNTNITWDIIRENPDKPWNWIAISDNKFQKEKHLFIEKEFREYITAYKIQQWWYKITMSPHYKIGRKFINKKYDELFD